MPEPQLPSLTDRPHAWIPTSRPIFSSCSGPAEPLLFLDCTTPSPLSLHMLVPLAGMPFPSQTEIPQPRFTQTLLDTFQVLAHIHPPLPPHRDLPAQDVLTAAHAQRVPVLIHPLCPQALSMYLLCALPHGGGCTEGGCCLAGERQLRTDQKQPENHLRAGRERSEPERKNVDQGSRSHTPFTDSGHGP